MGSTQYITLASAAATIEVQQPWLCASPWPWASTRGQGDQECEQTEAQSLRWMSHQAHRVHAGHDPGGMRLCPLRAVHLGAAQGLQGQVGPQAHQEKGWDAHLCPEEAGEAK